MYNCCIILTIARNMKVFASLMSEEDRTVWENCFNVAYIQPILEV